MRKRLYGGSCSTCHQTNCDCQPESKNGCNKCGQRNCGCEQSCSMPASKRPMKIAEHQSGVCYSEMQCVALKGCDQYYVSLVDENDTEPTAGKRLPVPTWAGPFDVCGLNQFYAGQNVGPQGSQGDTGSQGATGAMGDVGAQGRQGNVGAQGMRGIDGVQGADGEEGPQGVVGAQGREGVQGNDGVEGAQGSNGAQGITGTQGGTGNTGQAGTNGTNGTNGIDGVQGGVGSQGSTGVAGSQGGEGVQGAPYTPDAQVDDIANFTGCPATGSTTVWDLGTNLVHTCINGVLQNTTFQFGEGVQGATGSQGVAGQNGSQGPQGVTGASGQDGVDGVNGVDGINGEQGITGQTGSQGVQGAQGQRGTQGSTGVAGPQGVRGSEGQRGVQGGRGVEGLQGSTGAQGPEGVQGADGAQGERGEQGFTGAQGVAGAFGGPQGETGAQGDIGAQGAQGADGKDYDPNCVPPVVTSIVCTDINGNIGLVFDEGEDMQLLHFKDFIPTPYSIANRQEDALGNVYTINPNDSTIRWITDPTSKVIATNFEAGMLRDDRHQLITFDINSTATSACIGRGEWILTLDCDNCPCTVPTFVANGDGTFTINDGLGNVFTVKSVNNNSYTSITEQASTACPVNSAGGETSSATLHGCIESSPLEVPKWNCDTEFKIGAIEHDGHLYYNLVDGNTEHPSIGTSTGSYAGAFEIGGLIDYMVDLNFEARLTAKLTELGLI